MKDPESSPKGRFSEIAHSYSQLSSLQQSAGQILIKKLKIREDEDILDLGCGLGQLTAEIGQITQGSIFGVDPAASMIKKANQAYASQKIQFSVQSAEEFKIPRQVNVIFCNSSFQWYSDPVQAIKRCHEVLKPGGRIGMQAPAKKRYCPQFLDAFEKAVQDPRTPHSFRSFVSPWFFLESSEDYKTFFEKEGFEVESAEILSVSSRKTPDQVMDSFESGAALAYCKPDCYQESITQEEFDEFRNIVRNKFTDMADDSGAMDLIFNRIELVAKKP